MNRNLSLSSARALAPADFRRWVLGGISISLIGYTVITLVGVWQYGFHGEIGVGPQLTTALLCAVALLLARFEYESAAAVLALGATWCEISYGFLIAKAFPSPGMVVLPLLMVGLGLLMGSRVAFIGTVVSVCTTVLLHAWSPAMRGVGFSSIAIYWLSLHAVVMFAAWGLLALSMSGFSRVFREMQANERDLADTIRFAPDGILVLDGAHRVLLANPAAEAVLSLTRAHIVGRTLADVLLQASGRDRLIDATPQDTDELPIAMEFRRVEGQAIHVEATWRRMEGDRRQLLLRDVTLRVRAEAERRAMEERLAQQARLEAVGQLAGSLSHDFNNILTAVGGSAELLQEAADPAEKASLLQEILVARDRGAALTRQLLAFARREVINPRVLDLAALVRKADRALQSAVSDRHRMRLDLQAGCHVRADAQQLEQALVNLVANARDAMPNGGTCTIAVERAVDEHGAPAVRLHVIDEGAGMNADVAAHAFEPIFTSKTKGQGTGLGLASVYGTAVQSGGTARIASVAGRGTCVTLELPLAAEPPEEPSTPLSSGSRRAGPFSILVAEDDDAARSIVERLLRRAGYEVLAVPDGARALHVVESGRHRIDLVLTDVMMPVLNGPRLAARLRELHPKLPVLFMSGYTEESAGELGGVSGDRNLIAKPFSSQMLLSRIGELLRVSAGGIDPTEASRPA